MWRGVAYIAAMSLDKCWILRPDPAVLIQSNIERWESLQKQKCVFDITRKNLKLKTKIFGPAVK